MPCELDVRWSHVQPAGVGSHTAPGFLRDPAVPAPDEQERVPSLDSHLIEHEQVDRAPLAQHFEGRVRSEEHTSELQSRPHLVCRLLLEKKKKYVQSDIDRRNQRSNTTP